MKEINIDVALKIVLNEMMQESSLTDEQVEASLEEFKRRLAERDKKGNKSKNERKNE